MKLSAPFVKFALVGGAAAAVNVGLRAVLGFYVSYNISIVIAFFVALSFAFFLNRKFVYTGATENPGRQYGKFLLVNLLMLVQVAAVSWIVLFLILPFISERALAETLAHMVGVASPIFTSYFMHKYFTFASKGA